MSDRHEPTPEFLSHLERETRFALRRPQDGAQGTTLARLRTAALVVLALGAGAGCVVAAEHLQDTRRVQRALASNSVRVELAERRLAALRARLEIARERFAAGVLSQSEMSEAELRMLAAQRTLRHVQLEREELELGGRALARTTAHDGEVELELDLTTPLVGRRDFVSEHLRVDRESSAAELEHARREQERAVALRDAGVTTEAEAARALAAVASRERRLAALDRRLAARADFLQGRTTRETCERADLLLGAESRRAEGEALVGSLRSELARAEQLAAAGVAPAPQELRLDLDQAEAELALVALELDALR